jgi:signal peptidase I
MTVVAIENHPRRPRTAMLLSIVSPGLGEIYCGRFEAGIILFFCSMALCSLVPAAMLLPGRLRYLGVMAAIICVALWVYSSFSAARSAKRIGRNYVLKDYNRASVYILFSLMIIPIALGLGIFVRSTILAPYYVASDSMSPTFHRGQRILVSKLVYQERPIQRGDVVAFINPNRRSETDLKRVVALPGDRVEIIGSEFYVNNRPIAALDKHLPPMTVPNGFCFVLADHQGSARDSIEYGPVPLSDVIGQVEWIYWPSWQRVADEPRKD